MPAQVDTCTQGLLQSSQAAARERGIPLQVHAGQLISEFQEIFRRHGLTPIRWLDKIGLLTPDTIVSHAIMLDHYRSTNFVGTSDDLGDPGGQRGVDRACPLDLRTHRGLPGQLRALPAGGRQHRDRHGHLSAEYTRGDAPGAAGGAGRLRQGGQRLHCGHLQRRHDRRARRPSSGRTSGGSPPGRRPTSSCWTWIPHPCSRCATRCAA